jgi:ketosteroid isomerase-like protein
MMSNVKLAKDLYAGFARGDIPAVLAGFHPQIEWREAEGNPYQPDGAACVGPQAVLEKLFMSLGSEWEGFTVNVRTLRVRRTCRDGRPLHGHLQAFPQERRRSGV